MSPSSEEINSPSYCSKNSPAGIFVAAKTPRPVKICKTNQFSKKKV
jgi:hypothetical protein